MVGIILDRLLNPPIFEWSGPLTLSLPARENRQTSNNEYNLVTKLKKKRKWWVHPINSLRDTHGHFHTLYKPLREGDPVKFFNYLRMSIVSFDELLASVKKPLTKMDTKMRGAISPEEMLVITLRYLACGCSLQDLHLNFRIGRTTAGKVVRKVCQTIWDTLKEKCIPTPNESTWADIVEGFQDRANFPNCLGAVDGKHIRVVKPELSGSQYMNYKKKIQSDSWQLLMPTIDSHMLKLDHMEKTLIQQYFRIRHSGNKYGAIA
uniref:Protein ANTAGONIST OF LIKE HETEROCHROMATIN PROTEIN 1-like n=1 Tax=Leptobrachium leishanense TaxID=445787 RepID=A0A8C5PSJ8_9ANUR